MKRLLTLSILIWATLSLAAERRLLSVVVDTNGILMAPMNFFSTNANLGFKTNTTTFNIDTNNFAVGTRYTNINRRAYVASSFQLTAAVAGTAAVTLSVEQAGVTNRLTVSAGPLTSLVTIEPLGLFVEPNAPFTFIDTSSGSGASVSVVGGTSSRMYW